MPERDLTRVAATSEDPPHVAAAPVPPESGWLGRAVDALGLVFAFCFLLSTAIILWEIVARYVFDAPTQWVHETTTFLCGISFIFGGLYALSHDRHIRVVLIYDAVRGRARRALDVVLSAVGLVTMIFFAFAAWDNAQKAVFAPTGAVRLQTSGSAWNPPFPALVKVFLLVVIVVMAAQFVVHIVNHARGRGHGHGDD